MSDPGEAASLGRYAVRWGRFRTGHLAVQFGAAFALAMLVTGLLVFAVTEYSIERQIDRALEYHSAKFLRAEGNGGPSTARIVATRIAEWQHRKLISERTYLLYDRNGNRIAGRLVLPAPPAGFSEVLFKGGGKTWQKGRALTRLLPGGERLVVVQHSEAAANLRALLPSIIAAVVASAFLAGLAATFLFARQTARRLAETQSAANAIAQGDLSRRIATDRLDGMFAGQAESLNRMLDRMEAMVVSQRQFASALAHDLRTPLTRLGSLLAAERARAGAGLRENVIERAERECASIIAIFDALLRLAEIESGRHPSAIRDLVMGDIIEDVAETMEPVITDAGSELAVGELDPVVVRGDRDLISQMLVNLLENVVRHTPSGTRAVLSLEHGDGRAIVTISDNGPGLAEPERERVVLPFERGTGSHERRGSGLGLAIAQAIVRFHGGHLELRDNAPGLQVRVAFPVAMKVA